MAIEKALIGRIRRKVHDSDVISEDRPKYADLFYQDALYLGLQEVNLDLDTTYTVATVPANRELLLEIRATIEMCVVRAGEGAAADVEDQPPAPLQTLSVPNLSVNQMVTPNRGPKYWQDLLEALERRYARLLDKLGLDGPVDNAVQQAVMSRTSLRTGGRRPYAYDTALDARVITISEDGGVVSLSWSAVLDERFARYEVERATDADMTDAEKILIEVDNHTVSFDDSPGVGSFYYRVALFNNNELRSDSTVVNAVVT